jgi:hypothetical protein
MPFMKMKNLLTYFIFLLLLLVSSTCLANPHNLLPRLPELIIQEGNTADYLIKEISSKIAIEDNLANTETHITLVNTTKKDAKALIKFRVLYPVGKSPVSIKVNGKNFKYSAKNYLHQLVLAPSESATFEIKARVSVNYSINAVRKALREEERARKKEKSTFASDFAKYFNTEKYGKRFMISSIVSKWGIFPLDVEKVNIEVKAPARFIQVNHQAEQWKQREEGKLQTFEFSSTDPENMRYQGVLLPQEDLKEFLDTQEVLKTLMQKK